MGVGPPSLRVRAVLAAAGCAIALPFVAGPAVAQPAVEVVSGIRYATHGGVDLLVDVYLPNGRGPHPAVVVIPGGRWVEVDRSKHADVPTYFAEHGIAAFAIDYRSALESPYPAAIRDVSSAIRWVRAHADEYEVDASSLGAVGVSSGGHLAALVASRGTGPLDRGSRVSLVASWSGMMDLRPLVDADDDELREAVRTFLGCAAAESCTRLATAASPIVHVDPSDPPMVLVNGSDEIVPVSQAESMGGALDASGIDGDVIVAQGGHGAGYGGGTKILDQVLPLVQAALTGSPLPSPAPSPVPQTDAYPDAGGGGKGVAGAASGSPAHGADGAKRSGVRAAGAATTAKAPSPAVGAVAVAMIAAVAVVVPFVVIGRRRRRAGGPVLPRENDVPSGAGVGGA